MTAALALPVCDRTDRTNRTGRTERADVAGTGFRLVTVEPAANEPPTYGEWLDACQSARLPGRPHKLDLLGTKLEIFRVDGHTSIVLHGRPVGANGCNGGTVRRTTQIIHVCHNACFHDATVLPQHEASKLDVHFHIDCNGRGTPVVLTIFTVHDGQEVGLRVWWHNKRMRTELHNAPTSDRVVVPPPTHWRD